MLPVIPSEAQGPDGVRLQLNEQTIKAGLVYNFLKYTTWPEGSDKGHLRVCLFGQDPENSYLASLEGQTAQQSVISLMRKDSINDMADCSMVFVDASRKGSLPDLIAFLNGRHALTISDMNEFARLGGMVELTMENKRVALHINDKAISKAGLSIQGRLLRLAKLVSG